MNVKELRNKLLDFDDEDIVLIADPYCDCAIYSVGKRESYDPDTKEQIEAVIIIPY